SSRRRHTRSYGDWSSDVCSSDLRQVAANQAKLILMTLELDSSITTHDLGNVGFEVGGERKLAEAAQNIDHLTGRKAGGGGIPKRSEERRVGKEWRCAWCRVRCEC